MLTVYFLQTGVPLILLAWFAFAPLRNTVGFGIQALATGAAVVAISLIGLWTFPPWWTPYAFGGLLLAGVIVGLIWRSRPTRWPQELKGMAVFGRFRLVGSIRG